MTTQKSNAKKKPNKKHLKLNL